MNTVDKVCYILPDLTCAQRLSVRSGLVPHKGDEVIIKGKCYEVIYVRFMVDAQRGAIERSQFVDVYLRMAR